MKRAVIRRCTGLLLMLLIGGAQALEGRIEIAVDPAREVLTGSRGVIELSLLSDGFSFSDQRFSLPEVPGALLMRGGGSAVKGTGEVDGESWQKLTYDIWLFPQRAGRIEIPSFPVGFSVSMGYGKESKTFRFQTEPLWIEARVPPGAPLGQPLVSAPELRVDAVWDPKPSSRARVGDAYTLTLTLSADDLPGMVLPVLQPPVIEGMGVYPAQPRVEDRINRGQVTGRRIDAITFVCEREGSFSMPPQTIRWWNPENKAVEEFTLEGFSLDVAPNPTTGPVVNRAGSLAWNHLLYAVIAVLLVALPARRFPGRLRACWGRWKSARDNSERADFKRLRKACRGSHAPSAYRALTRWLSRWHGIRVTGELPRQYPDAALARELRHLQQALLEPAAEWSGRALERSLCRVRQQIRKGRARRCGSTLVGLNPKF